MRLVSRLRALTAAALCALLIGCDGSTGGGGDGPPGARSASSGVAPVGAPLVTLVTAGWHRGDHLGLAFQGADVITPTLDALARDGLLFRDASTSSNVTVPALAALHTGRSARELGLTAEGQALADEADTLAEAFAAAGWRTLAVLGSRPPGATGLTQGFERVSAASDFSRPAGEVVEQALRWLDEAQGEPTFLWVHVDDLGWPYEPSEASLSLYHNDADDPRFAGLKTGKAFKVTLPPAWQDVTDLPWIRSLYRAQITDLDAALAPLFAHERVATHWRAYVGTHGLGLGEHLTWMKAEGLYPGVLRVPLIVAGPGVEPGARSDVAVRAQDLAGTLLQLSGVESPGMSRPDLRSLAAGMVPPALRLALEDHGLSAAVDDGELLLIVNLQRRAAKHIIIKRKTHEPECYLLAEDVRAEDNLFSGEGENRARLEPQLDRIQTLLSVLHGWLAEEPDPSLARPVELDPGQLRRREELGYLAPAPRDLPRLWTADGCLLCQWLSL